MKLIFSNKGNALLMVLMIFFVSVVLISSMMAMAETSSKQQVARTKNDQAYLTAKSSLLTVYNDLTTRVLARAKTGDPTEAIKWIHAINSNNGKPEAENAILMSRQDGSTPDPNEFGTATVRIDWERTPAPSHLGGIAKITAKAVYKGSEAISVSYIDFSGVVETTPIATATPTSTPPIGPPPPPTPTPTGGPLTEGPEGSTVPGPEYKPVVSIQGGPGAQLNIPRTFEGDMIFDGTININSTKKDDIKGNIFSTEGINAKDDNTIEGSLVSRGNISISGAFNGTGNVVSSKDINLKSGTQAYTGDIIAGGNIVIESGNNSTITGSLFSNGTITINGTPKISGNVKAIGGIVINNPTTIGGDMHSNDNIAIGSASTIKGSLTSLKSITINAAVSVGRDVLAGADITVAQNQKLVTTGALIANGAVNLIEGNDNKYALVAANKDVTLGAKVALGSSSDPDFESRSNVKLSLFPENLSCFSDTNVILKSSAKQISGNIISNGDVAVKFASDWGTFEYSGTMWAGKNVNFLAKSAAITTGDIMAKGDIVSSNAKTVKVQNMMSGANMKFEVFDDGSLGATGDVTAVGNINFYANQSNTDKKLVFNIANTKSMRAGGTIVTRLKVSPATQAFDITTAGSDTTGYQNSILDTVNAYFQSNKMGKIETPKLIESFINATNFPIIFYGLNNFVIFDESTSKILDSASVQRKVLNYPVVDANTPSAVKSDSYSNNKQTLTILSTGVLRASDLTGVKTLELKATGSILDLYFIEDIQFNGTINVYDLSRTKNAIVRIFTRNNFTIGTGDGVKRGIFYGDGTDNSKVPEIFFISDSNNALKILGPALFRGYIIMPTGEFNTMGAYNPTAFFRTNEIFKGSILCKRFITSGVSGGDSKYIRTDAKMMKTALTVEDPAHPDDPEHVLYLLDEDYVDSLGS